MLKCESVIVEKSHFVVKRGGFFLLPHYHITVSALSSLFYSDFEIAVASS